VTSQIDGSARVRRTVSVVFADVTASTALAERLDPESFHDVLDQYCATCTSAVERHGGRVDKFIGDAVVGVFGLPTVHEDDALRAVRAALEIRSAVAALSETLMRERGIELGCAVGVNTGEVFAAPGAAAHEQYPAGDTFYVAARLQQMAQGGEILIGEQTHGFVDQAVRTESLGPTALKGRTARVSTWRAIELRPHDDAALPASSTPFVGRDAELDELRRLLAGVCETPTCQICTVVGSPGIGKSRLMHELRAGMSHETTALLGRCVAYGQGVTYRPLADIVRGLGDGDPRSTLLEILHDDERADVVTSRVLGAIGPAEGAVPPGETSWAVRRLFEALARKHPLIAVFEDLHWAEPTLLDLLEYVAESSSGFPILLLCSARPELLERRPGWADQTAHRLLDLEPLPTPDACELAAQLGAEQLGEPALARIVERAEGNPLFLEQLVAVQQEYGHTATLPPSIRAVLAARIDALEPSERLVLERASVEGRSFHSAAVVELLPEREQSAAAATLHSLVRRQLIKPDSVEAAGGDAFRFAHALVRETAYEGLPKRLRAQFHERVGGWLATRGGETDEIVGYHLEQAHRHWRELGLLGPRVQTIGRDAATRLDSAARGALQRGDLAGAIGLLERCASLLSPEDPVRTALLTRLGAALFEAGRLADADRVLDEATDMARKLDQRSLESSARVERQVVRLYREPSSEVVEDARRAADDALQVFDEYADHFGQSRAWSLRAAIDWLQGQAARADDAWARAAVHARRADEQWELFSILGWRASAALYGPTPVPEAIERCAAIREQVRTSAVVVAFTLHPLAALHAMLAEFDSARSLIRQGNQILEEVGGTVMLSAPAHDEATVEMLAGRPEIAEERLLFGYHRLEEMGEKGLLSTSAAMLAQAIYAQGRVDEAERFCDVSERTGAADDLSTQVLWRSVRGKILARQGRSEQGLALAREAVRLVERTDLLCDHGDALLDLAEVLRLDPRPTAQEERTLVQKAIVLYEQKGNLVSAERARSLLSALAQI
jgi:class 3 adenylate cyclase/tetratricopeptide (TPR) repeat protein